MKYAITWRHADSDHRHKRIAQAPDAKTAEKRFLARVAADRLMGCADKIVCSVERTPDMTNVVLLPWVELKDLV